MNKAIFYKEWIKTRWYIAGFIVLGLIIESVMFLKLTRGFRIVGQEHLWDVIINRMQFMFTYIRLFPLIVGTGLGIAQFLPEILNSRLKLSLHLPLKEPRVIFVLIGYSTVALFGILGSNLLILILGARAYLPAEVVYNIFLTVIPWFMAGFTSYYMTAFVTLEPVWKRKVLNILLAFFLLSFFFVKCTPGAFAPSITYVLTIPVITFVLVFYSVSRFKIGVQAS